MDFAPYQAVPPETTRSPTGSTPRTSLDHSARRPSFSPPRPFSSSPHPPSSSPRPPPLQHPQPQRSWLPTHFSPGPIPGAFPGTETSRAALAPFETSLGIRLDYAACLAYLALPPVGAVVLLLLERKSDYVRFHAWQASLLFTAVALVHYLLFWSSLLNALLWLAELAAIGWLTYRAYHDADSLDRYEVPFVGAVASQILDDE